jgi:ferric-dicitrate binding protein FerR (iron transport regulator)
LTRRSQLQIEVRDGRVRLEATNAPLYEVIRQLAKATGATLLLGPEVMDQRVNAKITDVPLEEALKVLAEAHGLVLERKDDLYILRAPGR